MSKTVSIINKATEAVPNKTTIELPSATTNIASKASTTQNNIEIAREAKTTSITIEKYLWYSYYSTTTIIEREATTTKTSL